MSADRLKLEEEANELLPFERIIVTGAEGFVGRRLVPALRASLSAGAQVTLATRAVTSDCQGPDVVELDVTDHRAVSAIIERIRPDLVVHLAGQASAGADGGGPGGCWPINFGGTYNIAEQLGKNEEPCVLLLASTIDVYGRSFVEGPASETTVPRPLSPYGRSKMAAEMMLTDVLPQHVRSIVTRATNHTGAGQDRRFVVPSLAAQIVRAKAGVIGEVQVGNLQVERDFLDVEDVVAAYLALLINHRRLPCRSIFNVASGRLVSICQVLDRLMVLSDVNVPHVSDPGRVRSADLERTPIDVTALQQATGWRPTRELDDTLRAVLADQQALCSERAA